MNPSKPKGLPQSLKPFEPFAAFGLFGPFGPVENFVSLGPFKPIGPIKPFGSLRPHGPFESFEPCETCRSFGQRAPLLPPPRSPWEREACSHSLVQIASPLNCRQDLPALKNAWFSCTNPYILLPLGGVKLAPIASPRSCRQELPALKNVWFSYGKCKFSL